jgi:hypothetical protein
MPEAQDWKMQWIGEQLAWHGSPQRMYGSHLYGFQDGKKFYFESRDVGRGSRHCWVRITEEKCQKLWNDIGFVI